MALTKTQLAAVKLLRARLDPANPGHTASPQVGEAIKSVLGLE